MKRQLLSFILVALTAVTTFSGCGDDKKDAQPGTQQSETQQCDHGTVDSSGKCTCNDGYTKDSNGTCVQDTPTCLHGSTDSAGKCDICNAGYKKASDGTCSDCDTGFNKIGDTCSKGEDGSKKCSFEYKKAADGTCSECIKGYAKDVTGVCKKLPGYTCALDPSNIYSCSCANGYTGADCSDCITGYAHPTTDDVRICERLHAYDCAVNAGNYTCSLRPHWTCSNPTECKCEKGYNGSYCTKCIVGYKKDDSAGTCDPDPIYTCQEVQGVLGCKLKPGWKCDNKGKCSADTNNGYATCDENTGDCTCASGYTMDSSTHECKQ